MNYILSSLPYTISFISILLIIILIRLIVSFLNKYVINGKAKLVFKNKEFTILRNRKLINLARITYVEISNRKICFKFEEKYDSISEVYNSFYDCFKILRDVLKKLNKIEQNEKKFYLKIEDFLNATLRKELTIHQKPYREWLEKQKKEKDYENEIIEQKKYPNYNQIIQGINKINVKALELKNDFYSIAYKKEGEND